MGNEQAAGKIAIDDVIQASKHLFENERLALDNQALLAENAKLKRLVRGLVVDIEYHRQPHFLAEANAMLDADAKEMPNELDVREPEG